MELLKDCPQCNNFTQILVVRHINELYYRNTFNFQDFLSVIENGGPGKFILGFSEKLVI